VAPVKSTPSGKAAKSAKPVAEAQSTTSQDTGKLGPLTQQLLKDTETWLKTVPKTRWVIQLVRSNVQHAEDFEAAADSASKALERDKLNAYSAPLTGTMRLGLLWGDFDSRQAALKAIANLPAPIAAWKPTARSVATIRTEPIG
jgi:septal ring-binding cell division protein DamX